MKPYSHAIYYPSSFNIMFHMYGHFNYAVSVSDEVDSYYTMHDDIMLHMDAHGFIYRFNKKHGHDPLKLIENFAPKVKETV